MKEERELLFRIFDYLNTNRIKNYFIELMYREFAKEIEILLNKKSRQ